MQQDLISVIIPCYNVEKYVSNCLDSVLNQTYSNLEIILIDDCSSDNTKEVLKEYVKKDKRIKLIENKKNSGAAYSRNVALKESSGKYIGFIDSDDYIDLDFYEKLIGAMDNKTDIAICDIKVINEEAKTNTKVLCYKESFNKLNVISTGLSASPCNKLFRKESLKYSFKEGMINEDIAVVIPSIVKANDISYANTYYYYIQRNDSVQNAGFSDKKFDVFKAVSETLERISDDKAYLEYKDAIVFNQLITFFLYMITQIKDSKLRKEVIKRYIEEIDKYDIKNNKYLKEFIDNSNGKHKTYYTQLFKALNNRNASIVNFLIDNYNLLSKMLKKNVIEEDIDIVSAAKKQLKLRDADIKVSVVIPNYNYARFMYQRIYSILNQNYKIHEIIILDDASSDNSKEIIEEIENSVKDCINIRKIYNDKNSGSAFKQWEKGFKEATGDYVWIAEADDYCEKDLISKLVKPIKSNRNVVISYSDTAFIDSRGYVIMKSIKPEIDVNRSGHWNKNYTNNGIDEIKEYCYLNNTIANVSSCIIKNDNYDIIFKEAGEFKQAGDWVFYLGIIKRGDISYIDKTLNYYRMHGDNVTSTTNYQKHLDEINKIYNKLNKEYKFNDKQKERIEKRIEYLKQVWRLD